MDEQNRTDECYYCKGKKYVVCPTCEGEGTLEDAFSLERKEDEAGVFQDLKGSDGWKKLVHILRHTQQVLKKSLEGDLGPKKTIAFRDRIRFINQLIQIPGRLMDSVEFEIESVERREKELLGLESLLREALEMSGAKEKI